MVRAVIALLVLLLVPSLAQAEKRVALVIGNSAYKHAPELVNPKNDADDIAAALKALGIEVIKGLDLDKQGMDREIRKFSTALSGADVGIFFYSGHGLQVNGNNYLVPVDAELSTAEALEFEMVRIDLVQRIMEGKVKTNILFLDACRNNPLSRNLARALGTRSAAIGRGLAPAESGVGTLVSFSTQPGNVALDGTGRNSPYTGPLVKRIGRPGEDVLTVLTDVRNEVLAATGDKQVPWENHALRARFYFNAPPATPSAAPQVSEAERTWPWVKDSNDQTVLENFIKQFGDSEYGAKARARLAEVKKQQVAVAVPPPAKRAPPTVVEPVVTAPPVPVAAPGRQVPERRRVMQLAFPDKSAAEKVYAALLNGKNFKADVENLGYRIGDIDLGLIGRGDILDAKVAEVAFTLRKEELSKPVEGRFGVVLLWVSEIVPGEKSAATVPAEPALIVSPSHSTKPLNAAEERALKAKDTFGLAPVSWRGECLGSG